jgi:hypothetical protein
MFHPSFVLREMKSRNPPSYLLVFRSLANRLIAFQSEHSSLIVLQAQFIAFFLDFCIHIPLKYRYVIYGQRTAFRCLLMAVGMRV